MLLFRRAYGGDSSQVVTPFVQVGTYPTRNFATLGPFVAVTPDRVVGGADISAALSTSPWRPDYPITTREGRVRRLVSEDSRTLEGSHHPCTDNCLRRSCPI